MAHIARRILAASAAPLALARMHRAQVLRCLPLRPRSRSRKRRWRAKYHPQFLAEFGGAMSGPHAAYVEQVGKNIAVHSGLGNAARKLLPSACSIRRSTMLSRCRADISTPRASW